MSASSLHRESTDSLIYTCTSINQMQEFYVGYLCDNIGVVLACLLTGTTGVTGSPSCYMTQPSGIPILSPVLFIHVGDPYIPPF